MQTLIDFSKEHIDDLTTSELNNQNGRAANEAARRNTIRILIVDDDPGILLVVAEIAKRLGYHTTTAEDALKALHHLRKDPFDVVITDYNMPFMNGHQLADQIRQNYSATKVIIMTGHGQEDLLDRLKTSRAVDGLLLKPFNLQVIKEKIKTALCC